MSEASVGASAFTEGRSRNRWTRACGGYRTRRRKFICQRNVQSTGEAWNCVSLCLSKNCAEWANDFVSIMCHAMHEDCSVMVFVFNAAPKKGF